MSDELMTPEEFVYGRAINLIDFIDQEVQTESSEEVPLPPPVPQPGMFNQQGFNSQHGISHTNQPGFGRSSPFKP